jgi:hypothetical protein
MGFTDARSPDSTSIKDEGDNAARLFAAQELPLYNLPGGASAFIHSAIPGAVSGARVLGI